MKRRFNFSPPKQTFATISGMSIFPNKVPSGSKQCTPSPADVHKRSSASNRNPSKRPEVQSAKIELCPKVFPSFFKVSFLICLGQSGWCDIPVSEIKSADSSKLNANPLGFTKSVATAFISFSDGSTR